MTTDHRAALANIKRFDQLIAYLRDEMGWPIARDSFDEVDDLFYDFTADELGIDPKTAAKIQEIKRLRPLSPRQPWGIFFVKFEPKRLPVVALRRILSQVALKKRASANSAERTAWAADDLLFVSNYGEGDGRQISFAHFSQDRTKADLPILKVLGWDDRDTAHHLDGVATELATKLSWPEDESDVERWREKWRSAFTLRPDEVVKTSKALAVELAKLARRIRDRILTVLSIETENGPITKLMKAFQEALVHDLDAGGFADMYAQTIAYGLLSARVTNPKANTADGFAAQLPVTNPFLKELMETFLHVGGRKGRVGRGPGIDFDELGVSEVVELLDDANMGAVVRDFGDLRPEEDPVTHFYELFLNEFDQEAKKRRGVFYTPRPVVSYIVRSVHELLQTEFGLADGLSDTSTWGDMVERHEGLTIPDGMKPTDRFVTILDPATGTGTFLVEAIEVIYRTLVDKWKREGHGQTKALELWNDYVPKHLLPRLHGYELLMAPYAIAHLKLGLKLQETGYRFESGERARVYLTNALEPASGLAESTAAGLFEALGHEAQAVNAVKRHQRFTVVIGNPPYANFGQLNRIPFILGLLEDYKRGLNERKLNLDDDFIKFVRLGQHLVQSSGTGLLGLITNATYLDGVNHRLMRRALLESCPRISIVHLHGNAKRKESPPAGKANDNVFDIMQGVAISLIVRPPPGAEPLVRYQDVWGTRQEKYAQMGAADHTVDHWVLLSPESPGYYFVPKDFSLSEEYSHFNSIRDLFPLHSLGFETSRDDFAVAFDSAELEDRIRDLRSDVSSQQIRGRYGLDDRRDWDLATARIALRSMREWRVPIVRCAYRPLDVRWVYFNRVATTWPRHDVLDNLIDDNRALICVRNTREESVANFFVVSHVADKAVISSRDNATVFPLWRADSCSSQRTFTDERRAPNVPETVLGSFRAAGIGAQGDSRSLPEEFLAYCYAVCFSDTYRARYAEFLKIDFPRLPVTPSLELFQELARLGGELIALHLLEAPAQQALSARYDRIAKAWRYEGAKGKGQGPPVTLSFNGPEKPIVEKVGWSGDTVWIDAIRPKKGATDAVVTGTIGFCGVPEAEWNFHIGGYQVCEKWLKDRKDRTLTADDIAHYHRIVIALHETIRLMREIDEVIERHGGWPAAFQMGDPEQEPALEAAEKPGNYGGTDRGSI